MKLHNWIIEFEKVTLAHPIKNTIVVTTSPHQEIGIVDTENFGRAVFLDGVAQSSAVDEHIYHEALVHPALVAHPRPQNIFIAGGGEGALLREVLKYKTVKRVVMVDLDEVMVDLAKQHLYDWHQGSFDDKRVDLIHEDAQAYLANSEEIFDVIIADLPDPLEDSPVEQFYTGHFFDVVKAKLAADGVYATQAGVTDFGEHDKYIAIIQAMQPYFQYVGPYQTAVPFFRSTWGFAIAGEQPLDKRLSQIDSVLHERVGGDLKFYDAETHLHMFSLPKYLRDALKSEKEPAPS